MGKREFGESVGGLGLEVEESLMKFEGVVA